MKIFFHNIADDIEVDINDPLIASLEQVVEIFNNLPDYDGSYLGLIDKKSNHAVQISKYDRFLFIVEKPIYEKQGSFFTLYTYHQVIRLIEHLFAGYKLDEIIPNFKFDKYITAKKKPKKK